MDEILYTVRVNSEKGYFSFYDVMAENKFDAERKAINEFVQDFGANKKECTAYCWVADKPMYKGYKTIK